MEENKNKHMNLDNRIEIQECLYKGMTFKAIALRIGKDPTTVSKEVKTHAHSYTNSFVTTEESCPKLLKAPFVCNGCPQRNHSNCHYVRRKYEARTAQAEYETVLTESRQGVPLTKEDFYKNERILSEAVKSGQHVYHAIEANKLNVSKSSVYRYINQGYYAIGRMDLPRAVKFKPRKKTSGEYVPKGIKIGRTYADFEAYMADNPDSVYQEMDTVIGRIGGKVIMTIHFPAMDFMFGILLEDKSAAEAGRKITELKHKLSCHGFDFGSVFPVLLTDNGGEFSNVYAFENKSDGRKESSVFFCDPNSPFQKPHIENNHTLFRNIVPGGTSFDNFSQDTVNLIFSHVNAVKRKQFGGKSAYDMFSFSYSASLATVLGIDFIAPDKVVQTPVLLKNLSHT